MIPTITPLPDPPSRSDDSDTFVERADAMLAALVTFVSEMNDAIESIQEEASSTNYNTVSTSSVAIGTGAKSFTVETAKLLQIGQFVTIASTANPANYMYGQVTSYDDETGALQVNVTAVGGSGTHASWTISLAAYTGSLLALAGGTMTGLLTLAAAASGQESLVVPHGSAPSAPTNGSIWTTSAGIFVRLDGTTHQLVSFAGTATLTNKRINPRVVSAGATSGSLTPNADTTDQFLATGLNGAITLAAPSGTPVDGQKMVIRLKDNGSSRGITWNAIYRLCGLMPLPTATTAGKTHYFGLIYNAADTKWDVVGNTVEP